MIQVHSIQILTASSAMVKTMTAEAIPGAFYFPEAILGDPRSILFSLGFASGK